MLKRFIGARIHSQAVLAFGAFFATSGAMAGDLSVLTSDRIAADLIVASDGSGDFTTLQAAIETIPANNIERITIFVRNGIYEEKVLLRQKRVSIIGESRDGVRLQFNAPRSEYDRRYDRIGPAVLNVFGSDNMVRNMTIENTQQTPEHAFAIYGQPQRFILDDCDVLGVGGDTLSLWNTSYGMYYHRNCRFKGGVDFVCPRGWCFVRDCHFESASQSAALWQDGHMDLDMKFILRNCTFDGPPEFWLGRNHYPSQFYLLGCQFSENLADKPIGVVKDLSGVANPEVYERRYYADCHREGGDYAWHSDNLETAAGSPTPDEITPAWTFDCRWDPESSTAPIVVENEYKGNEVYLHFSECVSGAELAEIFREDGSIATLKKGDGADWLVFMGGNADSMPVRLETKGDEILGTVASLAPRRINSQTLPKASPRKQVKIVLVGDSTVATYDANHPYQGWGWALDRLFDDRVEVVNEARGGRSSKSFRTEGHWDRAIGHQADYVLIQFGHNDNPGKGPERETDPTPGGDFRKNLAHYVEESRAAGAEPILVSPPTRRVFVEGAIINPTEGNLPYAEAVLAVAQELECPVVDLNRLTRELFERLGQQSSDWIQPVGDLTHFTPPGAKRIAATLASELVEAAPSLKIYMRPDALVSP
ncbi:pectinesterase family protein [Bythopirellula goksoeyrii]|uniref:Rhamnogalacturonan acetylesterase RhgT n=1 Tax=Bythopirellula goksoeyrii TaxID=1400387 RepID=A0A5B9QBW1_9BACT|nr:pectinesterase family protein [Bythopirellula goksoeyrii]QEG36438.1 Rhamnogalacturonan acetylesterase RhgT [Bythopirellula goksoeyrii]